MNFFDSPHILKPVNKMAGRALQSGVVARVSAKELRKIKAKQAADSWSPLDEVFEKKCKEVAASRKMSAKERRILLAAYTASTLRKFPGKRKRKRGIFAKVHW